MTTEEILYKLASRCSVSEQCISDIRAKLDRYTLTPEEKEAIIQHLLAEKYIDEQRYAVAFVRDKYRFNQWGRIKISQALRLKGIASDIIQEALNAIDEEEYLHILRTLIHNKRRSVKGESDYEINGKLIRFAISRGFEATAIRQCLSTDDYEMDI